MGEHIVCSFLRPYLKNVIKKNPGWTEKNKLEFEVNHNYSQKIQNNLYIKLADLL